MRFRWSSLSVPCSCHNVLPLTQASQNLVVLAREDAGAEKIFRSNGVQLLQRLLDTGEPDLMLAALRTLVGICSEHQSRVGVAEGHDRPLLLGLQPSWPPSLLFKEGLLPQGAYGF